RGLRQCRAARLRTGQGLAAPGNPFQRRRRATHQQWSPAPRGHPRALPRHPVRTPERGKTMSFFDQLQAATTREREALFSVPVIREALAGQVSLEGYRAFLGQAYHHVRHTVPLMMACGARLPSRLEWLRGAVCEYIDEEYGHERWILNDIAA